MQVQRHRLVATLILVLTISCSIGISTSIAQSGPYPGWMLFNGSGSRFTQLADLDGNIVHSWFSQYLPGSAFYLMEGGRLLRCGTDPNATFGAAGRGGILEILSWDGTVEWSYTASGPDYVAHHDVEVLPNGNILFIAWERHTPEEAIAQGRDPSLTNNELWSEVIYEVEPVGTTGGNLVWSWRAWDHLVQDFDPDLPNYGNPADRPGKINLNYVPDGIGSDWLHFNAVDYNPILDQIVVSSTKFDEIWIISHAPGDSGELKYRYGNPAAYGRGAPLDQMLFDQHNPTWIEPGSPGAGNILIFNNGADNSIPRGYSSADQIVTPLTGNFEYQLHPFLPYGPAEPVFSIDRLGDGSTFFSPIMSSAQRLPNGNTVVCLGRSGECWEFDANGNQVWDSRVDVFSFRLLRFGTFDSRLEGLLWNAVDAASVNVTHGILSAGGPPELAESDNSYLELRRNAGPIVVELAGSSPRNPPSQLTFILEASHSVSISGRLPTVAVTKQIELYNFISDRYEVVESQESTLVDAVVQVDIHTDAARFIEPGTGLVKARLTFMKVGLARGFRIKIDQAEWRAVN